VPRNRRTLDGVQDAYLVTKTVFTGLCEALAESVIASLRTIAPIALFATSLVTLAFLSRLAELLLTRTAFTTGHHILDGLLLGILCTTMLQAAESLACFLQRIFNGHASNFYLTPYSHLKHLICVFPPAANPSAALTDEEPISTRLLLAICTLAPWVAFAVATLPSPWPICVLLALILHELGHLAAMFHFGYQNLGVVFIPFLGAFAYGTNPAATSMQRLLILLAGPVPGIILGSTLVWLNSSLHFDCLKPLPNILILINLLNLLPAWPLDGGRICWLLYSGKSKLAILLLPLLCATLLPYVLLGSLGLISGVLLGFLLVAFFPRYFHTVKAASNFLSSQDAPLPCTIDQLTPDQRILLELHSKKLCKAQALPPQQAAEAVFDLAVLVPHNEPTNWLCNLIFVGSLVMGITTYLRPPSHQQSQLENGKDVYPYTVDDLPSIEETPDSAEWQKNDFIYHDRFGHMFQGWWPEETEAAYVSCFVESNFL
jgi:Zn-dependent protease